MKIHYAMMTLLFGSSFAFGQTAQIECAHRVFEALQVSEAAAVACQGTPYRHVTAIADCVQRLQEVTSPRNAATACQGVRYNSMTAVLDCFSREEEEIGADAAADLCQGVTYSTYTTRVRCFEIAKDEYGVSASAILCGGQPAQE